MLALYAIGNWVEDLSGKFVVNLRMSGIGFGRVTHVSPETQVNILAHEASILTAKSVGGVECSRQTLTVGGEKVDIGIACSNPVAVYTQLFFEYMAELGIQ